jgi:methionine-rich copper-binding protein CopC
MRMRRTSIPLRGQVLAHGSIEERIPALDQVVHDFRAHIRMAFSGPP